MNWRWRNTDLYLAALHVVFTINSIKWPCIVIHNSVAIICASLIIIIIRHITQSTDDHHESAFLFQRLSVLIQRYNAVVVLGTFTHTTREDEM